MNLQEWLDALKHASAAAPPEGFATRDLATVMNISDAAARSLLRRWHRSGMIEHSGYRDELRMDGRPGRIPIYRPTTKGVQHAPQESRSEEVRQEADHEKTKAFIRTSTARLKRAGRRSDRPDGE